MPASLTHRVRGERVPLNGVQLHLLEVIVDESQTPLWRARCLETGKLLTVALDGLVQVPLSRSLADVEEDYLSERRRDRWRFRGKLIGGSLLLAALAVFFQEPVQALIEALRDTLFGNIPE